ncbi:hypothetical protein F5Y09DRAFT_189622 [Xylaria sp. FL1042]|nr:hypothetical protein F5Y09DRAFT_189622 [Xylaria sp. FL1042]
MGCYLPIIPGVTNPDSDVPSPSGYDCFATPSSIAFRPTTVVANYNTRTISASASFVATASPSAIAQPFVNFGCWQSKALTDIFSSYTVSTLAASSISVERCVAFCNAAGNTFAALYGKAPNNNCACSSSPKAGIDTTNYMQDCNQPCSGEPTQNCGGDNGPLIYARIDQTGNKWASQWTSSRSSTPIYKCPSSTPASSTPASSTPASSTPASSTPASSSPGSSTPASSSPGSSTPASSTPASSSPGSSTPASSSPGSSTPASSTPASSSPGSSTPASSTPTSSKPASSSPVSSTPATSSPATSSPATSSPATSSPATGSPVTSSPATSSPASSSPATSSPATSSPASSDASSGVTPPDSSSASSPGTDSMSGTMSSSVPVTMTMSTPPDSSSAGSSGTDSMSGSTSGSVSGSISGSTSGTISSSIPSTMTISTSGGSGSATGPATGSQTSGTSPSSTGPGVPGITNLPADSFIILQVAPHAPAKKREARHHRRQSVGGFVGGAGPNNPNSCTDATLFGVRSGQLIVGSQPVATNPGVAYMKFTVQPAGTISRTFTIINGYLHWYNDQFTGGEAQFCQVTDGTVFILFRGDNSGPANCQRVDIATYYVNQCVNGQIISGPITSGAPIGGNTGSTSTGTGIGMPTGTGGAGGSDEPAPEKDWYFREGHAPDNYPCMETTESWVRGEPTFLPHNEL